MTRLCDCGCPREARPRGRFATDACRARAWKRAVGYQHPPYAPQEARNGTRNADSSVPPTTPRNTTPSDQRVTFTKLVKAFGWDAAVSVLTPKQRARVERKP